MTCDPNRHRRRSVRLRGCGYAQPGAYFVTIAMQVYECWPRETVNGTNLALAGIKRLMA